MDESRIKHGRFGRMTISRKYAAQRTKTHLLTVLTVEEQLQTVAYQAPSADPECKDGITPRTGTSASGDA